MLNNRLALITGASRGIGAAVAKALAKAGAHVILLARTQGALEALDDEIRAAGGAATLLPLDLKKFDEVDKIGPSLAERFGRLDIFIGNAGTLGPLKPAHQISPKEWQDVMFTNFMANVRLVNTLDPLLRASEYGRVIFTTAAMADTGMAYWSAYVASKAALGGFVKSYAQETRKTNLRVNMIYPGVVDTAMLKTAFPGGYPGKTVMPEDVAPLFLELAAPDCRRHGKIVGLESCAQAAE